MTAIVTTLDLLRHGEPQGGARFRGVTDDPLSEAGWQQMRAAVGAHPEWRVVVASPLQRCAAFAAWLAGHHGLPWEPEEGFREIGFGDWEGRTAQELMQSAPEALTAFWHDPAVNTPPGGEPLLEFTARVAAAWEALLARHAGQQVLVVAHGGVIRTILGHLLHMPLTHLFRLEVPFGAMSRVRVEGSGDGALAQLVFHGRAAA